MTVYKFANAPAVKATLDTLLGAADVTAYLTTGHGSKLPVLSTDEVFRAVLVGGGNVEWVTVTARSGDTLTLTRGTPAYEFAAGSTIEHRLDAVAMDSFLQKGDFRTVATDPNGSLAARWTGEEVYQSATGVWWKHCTGTVWKEMNL